MSRSKLEQELAYLVKSRRATEVVIKLCRANTRRGDDFLKSQVARAKQLDQQIKAVKRRLLKE